MGQIYYYHLKVITASSEERKKRNLIHKQTRWLVNARHYKFDLEMMYFTVVQNYEDRFFFSNVTISSKLVTSDKHQFLLHFLTVISNLGDITVYVISMDWFLFALQHEKKYSGLLYHFKTFLTFNIGNLHPYILKSWIQIDWWIFNQFFFSPPFKRMISVILLLAYFIVVYLWPCGVASIAILCLLWWYKAGVLILSGFIFCLYLLCIKMYFMIDSTFNYFFFFFWFYKYLLYCDVIYSLNWHNTIFAFLFWFTIVLHVLEILYPRFNFCYKAFWRKASSNENHSVFAWYHDNQQGKNISFKMEWYKKKNLQNSIRVGPRDFLMIFSLCDLFDLHVFVSWLAPLSVFYSLGYCRCIYLQSVPVPLHSDNFSQWLCNVSVYFISHLRSDTEQSGTICIWRRGGGVVCDLLLYRSGCVSMKL